MTDLDSFRAETRAWLEANCPAEMRTPIRSEDDICWGGRNWTFAVGRAAPVARGDGGARLDGARLAEGLWRRRAVAGRGQPRAQAGNGADRGALAARQLRHLDARARRCSSSAPRSRSGIICPQIARGEIRWCQGYSEPGAGSDLAGLQTKAEDKGDHWLVNGQKVWTSYADKADWIFCLVRTSTEIKQGGISFLLFDMANARASRPSRSC